MACFDRHPQIESFPVPFADKSSPFPQPPSPRCGSACRRSRYFRHLPVNLGVFLKNFKDFFLFCNGLSLEIGTCQKQRRHVTTCLYPPVQPPGCNDSTGRHPEGGRLPSVETARGLAQKHRFVLTTPPPPPRHLPDHHTFGPYINTLPPHLGRLSIPPPPPLACT